MDLGELTQEETVRRRALSDRTRAMISQFLPIESEDDNSILSSYRDFYLQISFSALHPLMVICLIRKLDHETPCALKSKANELNLKGVLGCHVINDGFGFYHYRSTHWLDAELTPGRFFEVLDRCTEDALRGYAYLGSRQLPPD